MTSLKQNNAKNNEQMLEETADVDFVWLLWACYTSGSITEAGSGSRALLLQYHLSF